jgi:hypothetical protein
MRLASSDTSGSRRGDSRRGRTSHATYVRVVGQVLTRDWYALETCEALKQIDLVGRLVESRPDRYPTRGWAVRAILNKAIGDTIDLCHMQSDRASERLAAFLEARSGGKTVTAIAREWGLSRECVSRTVARQAIRLVTDRVLALGRRRLALKESTTDREQRAPVRIA